MSGTGRRAVVMIVVMVAAVAALLAGSAAFVVTSTYRSLFPCTRDELSFADAVAEDLADHVAGVARAEVMTYDCDSGALPVVELDIEDEVSFEAAVDALRLPRAGSRSGQDLRVRGEVLRRHGEQGDPSRPVSRAVVAGARPPGLHSRCSRRTGPRCTGARPSDGSVWPTRG